MFKVLCTVGVLFAAVSSSAVSHAEDWGNLKGRFLFNGKAPPPEKLNINKDQDFCGKPPPLVDESLVVSDKGELANVVIWVRGPRDVKVHPDYAKTANDPAVIDNNRCRFEPHVLGMRTSQPLEIRNSDKVGHNTNAGLTDGAFNVIIAEGETSKKAAKSPEIAPVTIQCNIHSWMKGWLLVRPDPYFAVSDKDGKFEIKNLPAGTELEFAVWHEKPGWLKSAKIGDKTTDQRGRFKYTVKPGDNDLGDIKLDIK